jgi:hypothetical protein
MAIRVRRAAAIVEHRKNATNVRLIVQGAVVVAALATAPFLLLGCGLSVNSVSAATSGQSTTPPPGGNAGPTIPFPAMVQPLTGCSNPNTGTPSGDWGVGTYPVYTPVSNTTPVVGTPIYKSNTVFWSSRETAPGQSILLTGAFTDARKRVRLAWIPTGTIDWKNIVQNSVTVISPTQQGSTGISFIVPPDYPAGVYGFEIEDPSSVPALGLANVPQVNWAIGVPANRDPAQALQHQVHDCGVEPGDNLRIFGKNFSASNRVILQSSRGSAYAFSPSMLDTNSIAVAIPGTIPPGSYNVWVGSSPWDVTSSASATIIVYPSQPMSVQTVVCPGLVGDGVTDDTEKLQSCFDRYAPIVAGREVVYIEVPAGKFLLTGGVKGRPFEVLDGMSSTLTNFIGKPRGAPPTAWITGPQHFGITNLSFTAPANPNLFLSAGTTTGDPATSGHLFAANIAFASTSDASDGQESMFALAGPDVQVYNSSFLSNSNQVFDVSYGDGGIIAGNQFTLNNFTGMGIGNSQNVIFENNLAHSSNPVGQGDHGHSGGSGLSINRGNNRYGQSALSRNVYVSYNTFKDMGSVDQQIITNDGDGGSYYGPIASSTSSVVTLAHDPAWDWMGTTNPEAAVMAIVSGTGLGQYSFLQSYSGRDITIQKPWTVLPDCTSVVVIAQYELNMTFAHNVITDNLGSAIVLADALEGVIEDNDINNSGWGILVSGFGPYGGPAAFGPVINTDVLRNIITVGKGDRIWHDYNDYIAGIGIQDFPGFLLSGLMVRGNVVPSINTIYNTDGDDGISANVIEQNYAFWQPTFPTPGFLVQDNFPPPY